MKVWYWNNAKGCTRLALEYPPGYASPSTRSLQESFSCSFGPEEKDQDNQFSEIEKVNPQYNHHQRRFGKRGITSRQNGFAVDYEEEFKGQVCVGAPVLGKNARLVGSVWLVAPTSRLPKKNIQETAQKVMAAADKISQALGNQFRKVA